jgi:hypothetical protein
MYYIAPSVIKSNENIKVSIPKMLGEEFSDILKETQLRMAKEIAETYGIDYNEILKNCIPSMPSIHSKNQYKNNSNSIKLDVNSWNTVNSIDELSKFTLIELKGILKSVNLKVSGNKNVLIERLWEYIKG